MIFRRLASLGLAALLILSGVGVVLAFHSHQNNASFESHEIGHVLAVMSGNAVVLDHNGDLLVRSSCPQDNASLEAGWNVVALSDTPVTFQGNPYPAYLVAYPDPCQKLRDFSSESQIIQSIKTINQGNPSAAIGYVAADMLSETSSVTPFSSSVSPRWRNCWVPTCQDSSPEHSAATSANGQTLLAWQTGGSWDPHWWHVKNSSQQDAAVYGRDWSAKATFQPVAPASRFAYALQPIDPGPVQVQTQNMYQWGYVDFTLQFVNAGDRPLNPEDTWTGPNDLPAYCLLPAKDTALVLSSLIGYVENVGTCVPSDKAQAATTSNTLSFDVLGHFPYKYSLATGHFFVEYRGYPMLIEPPSSEGAAVSFTWPAPTATPALTPTATSTPTPTVTPAPTPTATQATASPHWYPLLQEAKPICNPGGIAVWTEPGDGSTSVDCSTSETGMQQIHNPQQIHDHYAEDDLIAVNGASYSQTAFQVQVQITFPEPEKSDTQAALVIQTPQAGCGGLIFALNASGQWQIEMVQTCTSFSTLQTGKVSLIADQATTLLLQVQNNVLQAFIAGQPVFSTSDNLDPSQTLLGLMVMSPISPSAVVEYANFELDMWEEG